MWNIKIVFVISLLLTSSIIIPSNIENINFNSCGMKIQISDNQNNRSDNTIDNFHELNNNNKDNAHGGSWLDSFEDNSKIKKSFDVELKNGSISPLKGSLKYISNGDFEIGILNNIPDNWTCSHHYSAQAGGLSWGWKLINTHFYSGSKALWGHAKALATVGISKIIANLSMESFENVSGAKYVYIFMRDLKNFHSLTWGWNTFINIQFSDGTNTVINNNPATPYPTFLFYSGQSSGTANLFNYTALGLDGQVWYVYKREIPKIIDTSNFNLTICWYAEDWTGGGNFCEISSVIDNIYFTSEGGSLISKAISKPEHMVWDSLIINKSQFNETLIYFDVLNASDNQPILNIPPYLNSSEISISHINPIKYPSLRLICNFEGKYSANSSLHYWGISWHSNNSWQDTFFGGLKVEKFNNINVIDGNAELSKKSSISSNPIYIPPKCYYNTLFVNKTEPSGTPLKITILDAQSNLELSNYINLTNNQIDISKINPQMHTIIRLRATFDSIGSIGTLHDWSLNWTRNSAPKIIDVLKIDSVNRTHSVQLRINLSDNEEDEQNLKLKIRYKEPNGTNWSSDYLDGIIYNSNHWVCNFTPKKTAKLGLFEFRFICYDAFNQSGVFPSQYFIEVLNNHPIIWNVSLSPSYDYVNRTFGKKITINATDIEESSNDLVLKIKCKHFDSYTWNYLTNKKFEKGNWEFYFQPSIDANLDLYLFNISCNDSDIEVFDTIKLKVLNNLPIPPDISISPQNPTTIDDLILRIENASDVETPQSNLKYWIRWYKNDVFIKNYENKTMISFNETKKGETWRCIVRVHDGDEFGSSVVTETLIINSPPVLIKRLENIQMFEDKSVISKNKLKNIFYDADSDDLVFSTNSHEYYNITVEITQEDGTLKFIPKENWFGLEEIIFYANDSSPIGAQETVLITVFPTNDLPIIAQIGDQKILPWQISSTFAVNQDSWLNLTIIVEDIDGDVERGLITYDVNLTDKENLYFYETNRQIIFHPQNEDVGNHYIKLRVTDNNETPLVFITHYIQISVKNVNDPPSIAIIIPIHGQKFREDQRIQFRCLIEDVDLLIRNSSEKFNLTWTAINNNEENYIIGYKNEFNFSLLKSGKYNITVRIQDSGGEFVSDSVSIVIEEEKKNQKSHNWIWISILIIIILICLVTIIFLYIIRKRRSEKKI